MFDDMQIEIITNNPDKTKRLIDAAPRLWLLAGQLESLINKIPGETLHKLGVTEATRLIVLYSLAQTIIEDVTGQHIDVAQGRKEEEPEFSKN